MSVPSRVQASPRVWANDSYATVWAEQHAVDYADRLWFDVEYGRFAPDGSLSAEHTVLSTAALEENAVPVDYGSATLCSILAFDKGFAIAWHEIQQGRLVFALLDSDGALIGEPSVVSTDENFNTPSLRTVWTGSRFGVLWGSFESVNLAVLDEQGRLLGAGPVMESLAMVGRLFLFWEEDHFAAWIENYHQALNQIYLLQLGAEGQPLGDPRRLSDPDTTYTSPLWVAQTTTGYRAVLSVSARTSGEEAPPLGLYEFDREGVETAPPQPLALSEPFQLAWDGAALGAVFGGDPRLEFAMLDPHGALRSNPIALAEAVPGDGGTRFPTMSGLDFHDGRFGVFYSDPAISADQIQLLYTEISCEPSQNP